MANIMERLTADNKVKYTARVRVKAFPQQTARFDRKIDAKLWMQKTEAEISEGKYSSQAKSKKHNFEDLAQRYIKTILKTKSPKVQVQYKQQLGKWCSMIGEITLDQITPSLLSDCRDKLSDEITTRGQLRTNAGVNRYMACL